MINLPECECGEKPIVYTNAGDEGCSIRCMECWAETAWFDTPEKALAAWIRGEWEYQEPIGSGVYINNL